MYSPFFKIKQTDKFIYCKIPQKAVQNAMQLEKFIIGLDDQIIELANAKINSGQWGGADIFYRNEFSIFNDNAESFYKIICASKSATAEEIIKFADEI